MGYRTTIKNINSIGHLIEGNVDTFFQQTISSNEMESINIELLEQLIMRTAEQFFMSEKYRHNLDEDFYYLRREWGNIYHEWKIVKKYFKNTKHQKESSEFLIGKAKILNYLHVISKILSRCKIKSILLPGFDYNNPINSLLTDENVLQKIVKIHPGDTALILQLNDFFSRDDLSVLNVFPNFDKALYQIDNWPGVFLWNKYDSLFLPVNCEEEIYDIFELIRYETNPFGLLRDRIERRSRKKNYAYLFHMSDLHFGNELAEKRMPRVVKLLEEQVGKLEEDAPIIPIITGDIMDSPESSNKKCYDRFSDDLRSRGFKKPLVVLGNHDVGKKGIFGFQKRQKAIISSLSKGSMIEVFEELKLVIIKFDSNEGGILARGEIGNDQLVEAGKEIDLIKNKDSYTYIALLHHHPMEIENPKWYAPEWYEAIFGYAVYETVMKLTDADSFLKWIHERKIKYVLHGHKHIPKIQKHDDATIVAAGSTTGSIKHKCKGHTYMSYNLIKYDIDTKKPVSVTIIAEEVVGTGAKNILIHPI